MHPKLIGYRSGVGQGLQSSLCGARRPHLFLAILLTLGLLSQRTLSRRFVAEHGTAMTGMFSDEVPEVAELPVAEAGAGAELASSPQPEPLLQRLDDCPTELDIFSQGPPEQPLVTLPTVEQLANGSFATRERQSLECYYLPDEATEPATPQEVHVQYSADPSEYAALLASLYSALRNSRAPGRLRFHLTIPDWADERDLCFRLVQGLERKNPAYICPLAMTRNYLPENKYVRDCMLELPPTELLGGDLGVNRSSADGSEVRGEAAPPLRDDSCFCGSPQFHIVRFSPARYALPGGAAMGGHKNDRAALLNPINFARNYADSYLTPVGVYRVIYLDADTIVQGDLIDLWDTELAGDAAAGVARSCKIHMSQLYDFGSDLVRASMDRSSCYINAGVYLMDLVKYKDMGLQQRIADLVAQHSERRLWLQGVQQPSFVLAIIRHSQDVDPRWNQDGLGYNPRKKRLPPCTLRSAYVLHWNGVYKPWRCDGDCYQAYWEPYRIE